MSEKFTVDESMSAGWHLLGEHFWTYTKMASLAILLIFLPDLASFAIAFNSNFAFLGGMFFLLGIVLKGIVPMGLIYIQLRLLDGQPVSSDDFWKPARGYFSFVIATLIYLWVVFFGLFFFVAPGIIFAIMFQFYPFFIVEHKLGPIQALKASSDITSGAMWELLLLGVLFAVIQGISSIFFIFGLVPAQVFTQLTLTSVYRTLLNNTPPEELSFKYNRDKLSAGADDDKRISAIATAVDGEQQSSDLGDTLTVGEPLQAVERSDYHDLHGGDSSRNQQVSDPLEDPSDSNVSNDKTSEEIASNETIGYDQPANDGVQMDAKESGSAKPVDNRTGENDKTADQF